MIPDVAGSSPVDRPFLHTTMTPIDALLLGIIQGVTEFFPVSSSGHLELAQWLLGLRHLEQYILFNLICHLGTLLALLWIFAKQVQTTLYSDRTRFWQVVLGTLPLFPLVLILKPIKQLFDQPEYLGYFFCLTALLLYLGIAYRWKASQEALARSQWRNALIIGMFQAVAILPGVSRSGATISAARMLGWSTQDAITFSFLLAIPAILGGVTLESIQLFRNPALPELAWTQYFIGFATSFAVGYWALQFLVRLAAKEQFHYFVWYCAALGIGSLLYFHS